MIVELNGFVCNGNIGLKAMSLIDLHRYGFKVPTSVALDSKEYFNTIGKNKDKIQMLLDRLDFNNIEIISKQIGILLSDIRLSQSTLTEILDFMNDKDIYLLRCSVDGVDENYSYSGLFPTRRGIDKNNIEENILASYKSLFSYNSLCYMLKNNIDYSNISAAIIIQKEVKTSILGYVTSMNPVTLNTSEYDISIVEDKNRENYKYDYMLDIFYKEDKYKILDKKRIEETIDLVKSVTSNLGYPVEIELAYTKSDIYILQTKELNSILYENQDTIWCKEKMSCKRFMYSLIENNYKEVINDYYDKLKIENNHKINGLIFNKCVYNCLNLSEIIDNFVEYDYSYFFNKLNIFPQLNIKNSVKKTFKRHFNKKILDEKIDNYFETSEDIKVKFHEKYNDYCFNMSKINGNDIEKQWLKLVFTDYKEVYKTYMDLKILNFILKNKIYNLVKEHISVNEYNTLIDVKEERIDYKISKEFNNLIHKIKNDEEAYRYWFSSSTLKILKNYKEQYKEYYHDEFKKFIDSYGYLSYFKFDLSESFYVEDVEDVIRDVKKQLASFDVIEDNRSKRNEINIKLEVNYKGKQYNKIKDQIKELQQLLVLESHFKDYLLRFNFLVKRYTKMLSKSYLNKKILDYESDIWYLDIDTIYDYSEGEISREEVNKKVKLNKIYFNSYRNFKSTEYIGGIRESLDEYDYEALGLSTGVIKGTVRKIKSLKELETLTSTDILVTKTINNNLLFKLPPLKGIIISDHNISNSVKTNIRELKIPCVILDNCSKKLSDNKKIMFDASNGYIKKLKK